MDGRPVFYDPTGRRPRLLLRLGAVAAATAVALSTLFILSLLAVPLLPHIRGLASPLQRLRPLPERQSSLARFILRRERLALWKEIAAGKSHRAAASTPPPGNIVAAFYSPWQAREGLPSLTANAGRLTHLMPEWLHLDAQGGLDFADWRLATTPTNTTVLQLARAHHLRILPILNNAHDGIFDRARVHHLLHTPVARARLVNAVRAWLLKNEFAGLNLDFENLEAADYALLPTFTRQLAAALNGANLQLCIDCEVGNARVPLGALAANCDFVVLMAYDQHDAGGEPGPIAATGWCYEALRAALREVPARKVVVGIGNYAYDWAAAGKGRATALSYQGAVSQARDNIEGKPGAIIDFDADALNSTYNYVDARGTAHEVWMLDAASAYNQWLLARRAGVRGTALWSLGSEDPGVWSFIDHGVAVAAIKASLLRQVTFPYEVQFEGKGEVLTVRSRPQQGSRRITVDESNGLITDMEYQRFPSAYVIARSGYRPRTVALTFDDGPQPGFSDTILDVLQREKVAATFFVIGENAEKYPALVRRMWRDGNDIGSHTFTHPNLGEVGPRRVELELNTTQRALQSILGRSTILFRPPYNADAEPRSAAEVDPIVQASQLGYVTVGESLDPQDWNLYSSAHGRQQPRTVAALTHSILREVHSGRGSMLLLHDGGGPRQLTVDALAEIIPQLKDEGYRFVTVSQLLDLPRASVMPALNKNDLALVGFDRVMFETIFTTQTLLALAFVAAIVLGIGRVLLVTPLAVIGARRERGRVFDAAYQPLVSVLIAAYNEASVVARTIDSLLRSDYPHLEIIVVDDGSTDDTAGVVRREFADDARVRLVEQANGGKAAALNRAIAASSGEVLIGLDADTQFTSATITRLVRHFNNPAVGAVAGNVKVGNRMNLLTRWQALEYITSQNLDRRAYALLNAVTVVPGAVGAWRRAAVTAVGGYLTDTLAEDMDLTWRLRRAGWRITTDCSALAYTEAPDSLHAFFKQRFRWAYGTLQCLYKHRRALGRHGWFGWLALPTLWLFQVVFQVLAPLVDLNLLFTLYQFAHAWLTPHLPGIDWQTLPHNTQLLMQVGFFYALFFVCELAGAIVAFRLDREKPGLLWWMFWQRFVYRQLMYAVVWKALWMAGNGWRQGWGKLQRKGTVVAPVDARPLRQPP